MENAEPLDDIPEESVSSVNSSHYNCQVELTEEDDDNVEASCSDVKEDTEDPFSSDELCVDTGHIVSDSCSLPTKPYENMSDTSSVYMQNTDDPDYSESGNSEDDEEEDDDDDDDDEGLYMDDDMPVKVELEEETEEPIRVGGVKLEQDEDTDYSNQGKNYRRSLAENKGAASASGNEFCKNVKVEPREEGTHPPQKQRIRKKKRRRRSYFCEEDKIERRRKLARERAKKYRDSLTQDQLNTLRERDKERTKRRRLEMTEEESLLMKIKNREQAQMRRLYKKQVRYKRKVEVVDDEEDKAHTTREKNRDRMRLKRSNMSEEERILERQKNRERVRKKREIQKAEALLQKLINVHSEMVKQNSFSENEHFLQSLIDGNKEQRGQKRLRDHGDDREEEELVDNIDIKSGEKVL